MGNNYVFAINNLTPLGLGLKSTKNYLNYIHNI